MLHLSRFLRLLPSSTEDCDIGSVTISAAIVGVVSRLPAYPKHTVPMESLPKDRPRPKGILRYSTRPPKDTEFEMFKLPKTSSESRGVVIAIEETVPAEFVRSTPSKAHVPKVQAYESPPKPVSSLLSDVAHEGSHHKPSTAPNRLPLSPLRLAVSPAGERSPPQSHTSSPTPIRSNSIGSADAHSPVMRSMFPRYDPKIPLAKQHYYPNRDIHRGPADAKLKVSRPSASCAGIPSQVETLSPRHPTVNTRSPMIIPYGRRGVAVRTSENSDLAPAISTPDELLDLWSVANGQGSQEAAETYTLKLCWYASTIFHTFKALADEIPVQNLGAITRSFLSPPPLPRRFINSKQMRIASQSPAATP